MLSVFVSRLLGLLAAALNGCAGFRGVDTVANSSRAFVALASAIPTVKTSIDHFCLLWCYQLLKAVAESLYKAIDLETRELVSDPSVRLEVAKRALFGEPDLETKIGAIDLMHRVYVQDGYHPDEYGKYALVLPKFLTTLLRTRLSTVFVIMYAVTLQILYAQVAQWQSRFNLQSTSSPQAPSQETFPSFMSMLNPAAHAPASLKNVISAVKPGTSKSTTISVAVLTVLTAATVFCFGYGKLMLNWQNMDIWAATTKATETLFLYAYVLGLLYALATIFSVLQRFVVGPVMSKLKNIADRLKFRRWMIIVIIHVVVQLVGQVNSPSMKSSKLLGLLVLASFVVFVLFLLALGGNNHVTSDQQHMQHSLFAVMWLSTLSWVGKVAYFIGVVRVPPLELSNDLLMEGGSHVIILSMFTYLISLSLDSMVPLPPTAFFEASSGQDAASVYGKTLNSSASIVKITAENCPKCIFEDGGPGCVLEEYADQTTCRVVAGTSREMVYVGPTFRVVTCDCVYRFQSSRNFCDFCVRSCRLCGGGNGNYQEAAKYQDFLEQSKVELAMHALVPMTFQICAAIQATYGLHRVHMSFYLTPLCVFALIIYHTMLRHPVEAQRIENEQRKRSIKKKKAKNNSKIKSTTTTTNMTPSTNASTTPATSEFTVRSKKKKKRKSKTSSAPSLPIDEASASS